MGLYVDLYFFTNALLDGLLLYLTGRITNQKMSGIRLTAGALVGTTGATLWYCLRRGGGTVVDFLVMLAVAGGMDLTVWGRTSPRNWGIRLGWLFGMSILLEGLIRLCTVWLRRGMSPGLIFLFAAMMCFAIGAAIPLYYRFSGRWEHVGQVRCRMGNRWVTFYGWLDSGNLLRDPIRQRPVIVVEEGIMEGIRLTEGVPIPYRTIDTQGKILWGFYPDELWLRIQDEEWKVAGVIAVARYPIRIHGCRAILPGVWLRKGVTKV